MSSDGILPSDINNKDTLLLKQNTRLCQKGCVYTGSVNGRQNETHPVSPSSIPFRSSFILPFRSQRRTCWKSRETSELFSESFFRMVNPAYDGPSSSVSKVAGQRESFLPPRHETLELLATSFLYHYINGAEMKT
jgi:hypothetical protein